MAFNDSQARQRHEQLTTSESEVWVKAANASLTKRISAGENESTAATEAMKDADKALQDYRQPKTEQCHIFESFSGQQIAAEGNRLTGIKFAGYESKNGYTYTRESLQNAIGLYSNQPVFLDHGANRLKPHERSARDLAGYTREAYMGESGVFGAVETLDTEAGRTLLAIARAQGTKAGMSHTVLAARNPNGAVTEIRDVISVDAVVFPATTKTFTESIDDDNQQPTHPPEDTMDLSKITLEQLMESRQDLVEKLRTESKNQDQLTALETQLKEARTVIEQYQQKEKQQQLTESIKAELKAANLDVQNEKVVSKVFMESLLACEDEARRKALIADRADLFSVVPRLPQSPRTSGSQTSGQPISESLSKSADDVLREIRGS